jgi:hypothetical protein
MERTIKFYYNLIILFYCILFIVQNYTVYSRISVCGLSVHYRKFLMTDDKGEK